MHCFTNDMGSLKHSLLHMYADDKTAVKINGMLIMNTSKEALFTVTNTSQRSSIAVWGRETVTECMHFHAVSP